mmetsp:Transcript_40902/g.87859  ORF Transcript_40902/g.87859 Transcript_40902/m.87859 type:complete len:132 (-) Transcript_40902:48-443(-)
MDSAAERSQTDFPPNCAEGERKKTRKERANSKKRRGEESKGEADNSQKTDTLKMFAICDRTAAVPTWPPRGRGAKHHAAVCLSKPLPLQRKKATTKTLTKQQQKQTPHHTLPKSMDWATNTNERSLQLECS